VLTRQGSARAAACHFALANATSLCYDATALNTSRVISSWATTARLLPLLLVTLPDTGRTQFNYTTNNGTITITGYTGPGGDAVIPDATNGLPVTSIAAVAFQFCSSLTSMTVPRSVTNIGYAPWIFCYSLTAITVDALNPAYAGVDGVLIDKSRAMVVQYPPGKAGAYVIPDGVASIGEYAFAACSYLSGVTIPIALPTSDGMRSTVAET